MFANMGDDIRRITLLAVTIAALFVVKLIHDEVKGDSWSEFALVGILSGAIGNFIDRFKYDAVVDFLDVYVGTYHWPAFNIADSAISVGVAILMLRMLVFKVGNSE